jgi:hypothetical protein
MDTHSGIINADHKKMEVLREILWKMDHPESNKTALEREFMRCFFNFSKSGIDNMKHVMSDMSKVAHDNEARARVIQHINHVLRN